MSSDAPVLGSTPFLGFPSGPSATESQAWQAPVAKRLARTRAIIASGAPPSVAAAMFNSRAVSVMGYIAQFIPPPVSLAKKEVSLISALLKGAGNFLSRPFISALPMLARVKIDMPSAVCWSALARATFHTFLPLHDAGKKLATDAADHVPMLHHVRGVRWPTFWAMPCIASRIYNKSPAIPGIHPHHGHDTNSAKAMFATLARLGFPGRNRQKHSLRLFIEHRFPPLTRCVPWIVGSKC